jgi:hypothetical protein
LRPSPRQRAYTVKPLYFMYHENATKDCPIFLESEKKMEQIPHNLHVNPHPEKSITPCSGLPTTSKILHPTLCIFYHKPIIITKPNLRHTTVIPLCHKKPSPTFASSTDNKPFTSAANHKPQAKQHQPSSQNRNQSTTSTSNPRTTATN